jgi:hypothetical protein
LKLISPLFDVKLCSALLKKEPIVLHILELDISDDFPQALFETTAVTLNAGATGSKTNTNLFRFFISLKI